MMESMTKKTILELVINQIINSIEKLFTQIEFYKEFLF